MVTKKPVGLDAVFYYPERTYYRPGINLLFGILAKVRLRNLMRLLIIVFLYNKILCYVNNIYI